MRIKKLLYAFSVSLVIINTIIIYNNIRNKIDNITNEKKYLQVTNDRLNDILYEMIMNQNIRISKKVKVINNKFDTISLNEVVHGPVMVFYFNEYSCMPCVDEIVKLINKRIKKSETQRFIILSHYNQIRDMYLFNRVNHPVFPVFNLAEDLPVPALQRDIPFLFYLDSNFTVSNLLLIDKSLIDMADDYLTLIEKNLK